MTKDLFLKTVKSNFNLDINLIPVIEEMILSYQIDDFNSTLALVLKSNKYSFLDRLRDAMEVLKNESKNYLLEKYNIDDLCKKLYEKTTSIFDEINWRIQTENLTLRNFKIDKCFEAIELKILSQIGKRERIMHLCKQDRNLLLEKIKENYTQLILNSQNKNQLEYKDKAVISRLKLGVRK